MPIKQAFKVLKKVKCQLIEVLYYNEFGKTSFFKAFTGPCEF